MGLVVIREKEGITIRRKIGIKGAEVTTLIIISVILPVRVMLQEMAMVILFFDGLVFI